MDKYITPNGSEVEESILRERYGDRFDSLVAEGVLKKKELTESVESVSQSEVGLSEQPEKEYQAFTSLPMGPMGVSIPSFIESGEKPTMLERAAGKNTVTDFFGDLYRAYESGLAQGATIDETASVFANREEVSDEDLNEYIASIQNMESYAPSDEMMEFQKINEENGGGILGFVKGVGNNPSVLPEIFTSSMFSMINKGSLAAGAVGAATGAATGAAAGAIGGPLAGVTASGGAIAGAIFGASGALETGLSFTEFLKEEIKGAGLEFDNDGIRKILEDDAAISRITNRALARGISIAAIDAFTGGLATKLTTSVARKAGSKLAGTVAGIGTEAIGGGLGEATGMTLAGQELNVADIGFEALGGTTTAPLTVGMGLLKAPKYELNNQAVTRRDIQKRIDTATPEEIAGMQFTIKNDPDIYNQIQTIKSDAIVLKQISDANPGITQEDRVALLDLEKRRSSLENSNLKSAKNNLKVIDEKIDAISEKYKDTEEKVVTTDIEAKESLAKKGILEPTERQILDELDLLNKEKLDAIQEPGENKKISILEQEKTRKADGFDKSPVYKKGNKPVLFHGSPKKFTEFDIKKIGSSADAGDSRGIFFTSDPEVASFFSKETGSFKGNVIQSIKSLTGSSAASIYSATLNTDNVKTIDFNGDIRGISTEEIQRAFDEGYDALILKNIVDGPNKVQDVTVVKDMSVISDFKDTQLSANKLIEKYKLDAIQEPGPEKVDVPERTEDSGEMGTGDTEVQETTREVTEEEVDVEEQEAPKQEVEEAVFESVDEIVQQYPDVTLDLNENKKNKTITVSKIEVPKESRGKGIASSAMEEIIDYADRNGLKVLLTPTDEFGSSKKKLIEFYKRFGFKQNKGRNRDFSHKEDMYRVPQERITGFVTEASIQTPFLVKTKTGKPSSTQINFTEDGKIASIVNIKTGKEVGPVAKKAAEKQYLTSVVDVNEGKKAQFEEGIPPERANEFIASNSQNIREIAEAIKNEEAILESKKEEASDIKGGGGLFGLVGEFFTMDSWKDETGLGKKDMDGGFINRWIRTKDKGGKSIKDGAKGYTKEEVVKFIQDHPNQEAIDKAINYSKGESNTLIDLKDKFTELTGVIPTPINLETVLSINPDRAPISVIDEKLAIDSERALVEKEGERNIKGKKVDAKKVVEGTPKTVEVDEAKALKDQIKLEIKAARDAKLDQTKRRKALSDAINNLVKKSSISIKKGAQLIKQVSGVNLNNPVTVERVLSYVEKTFDNAEYAKKISDAESTRKAIKKLSSSTTLEANAAAAAKEFLKVDPLLVENIDTYLKEAAKVKLGVTPTKKAGGLKITPAVDIDKTLEYSKAELKRQDKIAYELEQKAFEEATGLSADELSLSDMREIVYGMDMNQTEQARAAELESKANNNADVVRKGLNKAFNLYSTLVNQLLKTSVDPFTRETISLTKEQKNLVKDFLQIDINEMSDTDAIVALDSLINFATNKTTGGMGAIVKRHEGNVNAKTALNLKLIAKPLTAITSKVDTGIARAWSDHIATLPLMLEMMFKGQGKVVQFNKLSGLSELFKGASTAVRYANQVADDYSKAFIKKKPNGEAFNTAYNDIERGMVAFMRRTILGQEQSEFERRKGLIEQSIDALIARGGKDAKKGEQYKSVYENILSDSKTIEDVESNADPINLEAVEWMTKKWSENYKQLSGLSLDYYNKILGDDINYTTDSYSRLDKTKDIGIIGEPIFDFGLSRISDKKSGVLMEATRPNKLPKDRVINLGFDSSNIMNLERAKTDLETAPAIQKLKGFFESNEFNKIIPNEQDRTILKDRVIEYVEAKRGREFISKDAQKWLKLANTYSGYAVSRTLGQVLQSVKQTLPVLSNTIMNVGPLLFSRNMNVIAQMMTEGKMAKFLNNSGYSTVNRGMESTTTLNSINSKIENAVEGIGGYGNVVEKTTKVGAKVLKGLNQAQNLWLKAFLVAPDKYIAKASWMLYYIKSLENQGIDTSNIDWENHEINTKAGDYAQYQVDRNQNVSDADLQGKIFRSKDPKVQIARRIVLPFANFLLNQKTRMYSDITVLSSKTATVEDKKAAVSSLGALAAETTTFNLVGLAITQMLSGLSDEKDESEEDRQKRLDNRLKGRGTQIIKDIVSPFPYDLLDETAIDAVNALIRVVSEEEDPYQFFNQQPENAWERTGMFNIPKQKYDQWNELRKMAFTGEYKTKPMFGKSRTKQLTGAGQDDMMINFMGYTLYALGLLPAEVGTIVNYNVKSAKKNKSED